jgi:DNA-directed RNA polymerase specialized sigma24 family protein
MTEQEALARLQNGDREALAWIYQNCRDAVALYFIRHHNVAHADARELVVDIVMRFDELVAKGKYPRLTAQLTTILIEIGKNVVKEYFRGKKKKQTENEEWEEYRDFVENTEGGNQAFEVHSYDDFLDKLPDMVQNMDDKCAQILHQYYWLNLSDRDIAINLLKAEGVLSADGDLEKLLKSPDLKKQIDARTATVKTKRWDCIRKLR